MPDTTEDLDHALSLVPEELSQQARTQLLLSASHSACHEDGPHFKERAVEALRLAREAGDRDAEAQALAMMAMIDSGPLGVAEPEGEAFRRLIAQARAIAQRRGADDVLLHAAVNESHLLSPACARAVRRRCLSAVRPGSASRGWSASSRRGPGPPVPARVLCGYCLELSADGLPFAPFTGVLRELVHDLGVDPCYRPAAWADAAELARLLPELGEPGCPCPDPDEGRARMFEQALSLFERLAGKRPARPGARGHALVRPVHP